MEQTQQNSKRLLIYLFWYVAVAWALAWLYFLMQGAHLEAWPELHRKLLNGGSLDSNQFRLLAFWIPEMLHRVFRVDIVYAYVIYRFVCSFVVLVLFHYFLLKWFDHLRAWLGTMLLAFFIVVSYLPLFQESDILVYIFFILGLLCLRLKKYWWLAVVLFVGTFAKETLVFLIPLVWMIEYKKIKTSSVMMKVVALFGAWLAAFLITRFALYDGQNSSLWQIPHNLSVVKELFSYPSLLQYRLLWIPLFGIVWFAAFLDRPKKSGLLAAAGPYSLIVIVVVLISAWPEESRLLVPTLLLALPSAMVSLESKVS